MTSDGQEWSERRYAAVCGEYCLGHASARRGECRGCGYQLGCTLHGDCRLFTCAIVSRGIEHCGLCPEFPCREFLSNASPEMVERRVRSLNRRREIGTERWLAEQSKAVCRGDMEN
jgi:hypothetical protein